MAVPHARILIVEDEPAICMTLELLLHRRGYAVTTVSNGCEGYELIRSQQFDLLLLDLHLPGYSGLELAEEAGRCQPATRVLILTGSSASPADLDNPRLKRFEVMLKTASPQQVLDRIAALTRKQYDRQIEFGG